MDKPIFPTDPVTVDLGDGVERELRYNMGSMRRLKKLLGTSVMLNVATIEEDKLPECLMEGLVDKSGIASADALADMIRPAAIPYIIGQFTQAFFESMPTPKDPDPNAQSSQPTVN